MNGKTSKQEIRGHGDLLKSRSFKRHVQDGSGVFADWTESTEPEEPAQSAPAKMQKTEGSQSVGDGVHARNSSPVGFRHNSSRVLKESNSQLISSDVERMHVPKSYFHTTCNIVRSNTSKVVRQSQLSSSQVQPVQFTHQRKAVSWSPSLAGLAVQSAPATTSALNGPSALLSMSADPNSATISGSLLIPLKEGAPSDSCVL